jgi:hypothetical protein
MFLDVLADNFLIAACCRNIMAPFQEMLACKVFPLAHILTGDMTQPFSLDVAYYLGDCIFWRN